MVREVVYGDIVCGICGDDLVSTDVSGNDQWFDRAVRSADCDGMVDVYEHIPTDVESGIGGIDAVCSGYR